MRDNDDVLESVILLGINAYITKDTQAIGLLKAAVELSVSNEQSRVSHYYLGMTYLEKNDYIKASNHLMLGIVFAVEHSGIVPSDSEIYVSIATVEEHLNNWRTAKEYLNLAIASSPNNVAAWHNLGVLSYKYEDDLDLAINALRNADALASHDPLHLETVAAYLRDAGRLSEAEMTYSEVFNRGIETRWGYEGFVKTKILQGRFDNACEIALECVGRHPEFGECWKWAGIASMYIQDFHNSVNYMSEAAANGSLLIEYCQIYEGMKNSIAISDAAGQLRAYYLDFCDSD